MIRPEIDAESEPFWSALREGVLRLQRCSGCHEVVFYPRAICPACQHDSLEWRECRGDGIVHSYTVVHHGVRGFDLPAPYVVALVDLDEGPRLLTNLVGVEPTSVSIGQRVSVVFDEVADDLVLPRFRPR